MRRFFSSIRFRMVAIYFAVMILAFVAVSALVTGIVENLLVSQRIDEQRSEIERLSDELSPYYAAADARRLILRASEWVGQEMYGGRVLLLDCDAVVQVDTSSLYNGYRLPYREVRDVLVLGQESAYGFHLIASPTEQNGAAASEEWAVYHTTPLTYDGQVLGVLLFSSSIQDVRDNVDNVTRQIGLIFAIFALAVGVISLFVSGWLTRPIVRLTSALRRVGAQGYGERVGVRGQGEIAEMAKAFNIMSEKLEHHDKLRDEFVSNASHELKTPLSTMKILAESMLYQETPDLQMSKEFFADIDHEVDRLTGIINDLLSLVHADSETAALEVAGIDFGELIGRVIKRLTPLAKNKGLALTSRLVPVELEGDASKLEQVVTNIIDNAIKYTDTGGVHVSLKLEGAFAVLTVKDTGIGIPQEAIPRLFERFYRVDKARSRDTGGTGLGLSIVERIVSLHGGYIRVESGLDAGTTFIVSLPLAQHKQEGGEADA